MWFSFLDTGLPEAYNIDQLVKIPNKTTPHIYINLNLNKEQFNR